MIAGTFSFKGRNDENFPIGGNSKPHGKFCDGVFGKKWEIDRPITDRSKGDSKRVDR